MYTPGPWQMSRNGNYSEHDDGRKYLIGGRPDNDYSRPAVGTAQHEADAVLMAAAPELLEAAERLVERTITGTMLGTQRSLDESAAIKHLINVIRKAKGL